MSSFASDFVLAQFGGERIVKQRVDSARVLLARNILARIARRDFAAPFAPTADDWVALQEALQVIELRGLDLMQNWLREPRSEEGTEFRRFCSSAFELRRVHPKPEQPEEALKFALHLASVAVLGDRTADIRRHFKEEPWQIPAVNADQLSWAQRLFYTTADAFLRLVRKEGWSDLEEVANAIRILREQQRQLEPAYLAEENGVRQAAAFELVAFYHLAKAVEILGMYTGTGEPTVAVDQVDFHFSRAVKASDTAGIIELSLLLRWMQATGKAMIRTTIWHQLAGYNSRVSQFKKTLTLRHRPLFELLPPQREAIQELMNIGNRALVVEMPTSSGKTLLAEFRILQTKVNVADSWIAYLVPTRALVNQIAAKLRRDLSPLGLKIEVATPAIEVDVFEDELLRREDSFDVLVTTPEKLDLLIRSEQVDLKEKPLGLVILDEAHNISEGERGLRSELLLATINRDSRDTHFLLLTPFVPNADELATWLDEERSKCIKPIISVDWQPNDRLIGLSYLSGRGRWWGVNLRPLHTSSAAIHFEGEVPLSESAPRDMAISQARASKKKVAAEIANALAVRECCVVLAYSPADAWDIAQDIEAKQELPPRPSEKRQMVKRFVEAEYGDDFILARLLDKGIGVHHAGISPETRYLLEWLTEEGELRVMVATSTLAQGVNFPISSVILASHQKPRFVGTATIRVPLQSSEFWNIAGRAGRLDQDTLGLVIFASLTEEDGQLEDYVKESVRDLVSALEEMIEDTMARGWDLNLRRLVRSDAKWSGFVQFLAHSYKQIGDHTRFLADTEMLLKRTFAYHRLSAHRPELAELLLDSSRAYAEQLKDLPPGILSLVDATGFSPETVAQLLAQKDEFRLDPTEWSPSRLFRSGSEALHLLVGHLLNVGEISLDPQGPSQPGRIAPIISMWVGGKSLREIAEASFGDVEDESKRMTECCRMIFQRLTHGASWGLGALQTLAGIEYDKLSSEQRENLRTLPAMVYYGCETIEGVLMRTLAVPRQLCVSLGERYKQAIANKPTGEARLREARNWLSEAPAETWQEAAGPGKMSGTDYRNVWRVLNGHQPEFG